MEIAPGSPASYHEKSRLPSPTAYDGSTLASASSPGIRPAAFRNKHHWHKRLAWKKSVKPSNKTVIRKLEDHPIGYPRQSAFADSDESFMIFRRFGYIHARLLMQRQDELRQLEDELEEMDKVDSKSDAGQLCLQSREMDDRRSRREQGASRSALLHKIEDVALRYGELLQQAQNLVAMNKPPMREQISLRTYIENRQCLVEAESAFAYHKEDLVTLRPGRDHSFVDAFVEHLLKEYPCKPLKETASKSHDPRVRYFTRGRINAFVTLIITSIILALLVVPIWLLYHFSVSFNATRSNVLCMGVLLVATLVFSAVLSLFTKARRHEVLAASAGYCAVLVVFVGNIGNAGISDGMSLS
ncbi:hypothetical protein G7Y79_00006g018590 [Physcia stellaris]|nr:hypothetical protein G7Y79_00006g018590 [Physcia stellaris]